MPPLLHLAGRRARGIITRDAAAAKGDVSQMLNSCERGGYHNPVTHGLAYTTGKVSTTMVPGVNDALPGPRPWWLSTGGALSTPGWLTVQGMGGNDLVGSVREAHDKGGWFIRRGIYGALRWPGLYGRPTLPT